MAQWLAYLTSVTKAGYQGVVGSSPTWDFFFAGRVTSYVGDFRGHFRGHLRGRFSWAIYS